MLTLDAQKLLQWTEYSLPSVRACGLYYVLHVGAGLLWCMGLL